MIKSLYMWCMFIIKTILHYKIFTSETQIRPVWDVRKLGPSETWICIAFCVSANALISNTETGSVRSFGGTSQWIFYYNLIWLNFSGCKTCRQRIGQSPSQLLKIRKILRRKKQQNLIIQQKNYFAYKIEEKMFFSKKINL